MFAHVFTNYFHCLWVFTETELRQNKRWSVLRHAYWDPRSHLAEWFVCIFSMYVSSRASREQMAESSVLIHVYGYIRGNTRRREHQWGFCAANLKPAYCHVTCTFCWIFPWVEQWNCGWCYVLLMPAAPWCNCNTILTAAVSESDVNDSFQAGSCHFLLVCISIPLLPKSWRNTSAGILQSTT